MREVFSSPRLENVEQVAKLLRDAGIEVRITNGRSYRGNRRSNFSYSDRAPQRASVWVIQSDQQPRAREMLREAGLLDTTRAGAPVYTFQSRQEEADRPARRRMLLVKTGLLLVIAAIGGTLLFKLATQGPREPELAAGPFDGSVGATVPGAARAVLAQALDEAGTPVACLGVDGANATPAIIDPLRRPDVVLVPANHCVEVADEEQGSFHPGTGLPATLLRVSAFRASGEESATVEMEAYHHRGWATYKTLQVDRIDGEWQVTDTLRHVESRGLIGF